VIFIAMKSFGYPGVAIEILDLVASKNSARETDFDF